MKTNTKTKRSPVLTHEGGKAQCVTPYEELRRAVLTCMLWEDTFYEKGSTLAERIISLVQSLPADKVAALAIEARNEMQLRHVPLFLVRQLARIKGNGILVADTLEEIIQRTDEITEFVSMYWMDGRQPLSAGVKRGLAKAFQRFNDYQLAKYNRDETVKLRDVLFLCHAKPKDQEQEATWKALINGTLQPADTWEVALSSGKDKKETFERLLKEGKLGGMAVLRNLRNMLEVGVNTKLIKDRLSDGIQRALPFRFITAAKHAPDLEKEIEHAMFLSLKQMPLLKGRTLLVVDISGSMQETLSGKSEITRQDTAAGLAILIQEICEESVIYATAGNDTAQIHATARVPSRNGFALKDAIGRMNDKLGGGGIFLKQCMDFIFEDRPTNNSFDRVIIITDEQDCDRSNAAMTARLLGKTNYIINIGNYDRAIGYGNGWTHINGWSERVIDYIQTVEKEQ